MYYRGSQVSSGLRKTGFPGDKKVEKTGVAWKVPSLWKPGKGGTFTRWGKRESKSYSLEAADRQKVYAFYRPGVTPGRDLPRFPERPRKRVIRVPAWKGKHPIVKILLVLALGLVVAWAKNKSTALLQDMAGLKLSRVIVQGNHYLTEEQVIRVAGLPLGVNMFKLKLDEAAQKVRGLDWVERVFMERRLPQTVLISVVERKPAVLLDSGALYGMDRNGRVLSPSDVLLQEDLPLISGVSVEPDALGTTRLAEAVKPALDFFEFVRQRDPVMAQDISEMSIADPDSLKVTFIDGITSIFNPEVTEKELRRMALVLSDLSQRRKKVGTMDFRYKDMVLVKTR